MEYENVRPETRLLIIASHWANAGRYWGQEEKGTTKDEMAGWHHWLDGRESEWTLGVGDGQGGLVCWDSWGHKESDMTERLDWTELSKCTGHRKHPLPTTQEKTLHMDITRWSILKSDWLYSLQPKMEKLYTVSKNKTGSWLWLKSWTLYCQIQLKLKKVGKTTRPFRYDLNQIPYDYMVEVTNRLKGLDLIECLKIYGRRLVTFYRRQWSRPSARKRNAKRQNGCLRRPYK